MPTLSYKGLAWEVDHAVKGTNYICGYGANGECIISINEITDFNGFAYTGTYMTPDSCLSDTCNDVKHVSGKLVRRDGTSITPSALDAAPAGYGLGGISYNATTVMDANDAYRNGWYRLDSAATNGIGYAATLRVEAYSSAYVVQTAYRHTSSKIITWRRYCLNGTWTEWEDITPVAGSGLGVLPLSTKDLNTCTKNGWYAFGADCVNTPEGLSHGSVLVVTRDASRTTQILFGINIDGNPQMIRYTTDSGVTWIENWVNPRMNANTEYRTTEQLLGKAVYKKADSNGNISYRLDGENLWRPEHTQIIKLWENRDYDSSFGEQMILLPENLSGFDLVEIIYNYSTDTPTTLSQRAPVTSPTTIMSLIAVSGANNRCGTRRANINIDGSILFEDAHYNESTSNKYIIPVAVYGIKSRR